MSVKAGILENAERDLTLTNREAGVVAPALKRGGGKAEEELIALRQRIADAQTVTPSPRIPECTACYRRGWADALKSLE